MTNSLFLTGRILLAMPGMFDPNFDHAVIAMYAHDENGAFGVGIGHVRSDITFHQLLRKIDIDPGLAPDGPVHHGGPVEPGRGFILHSPDWSDNNTMIVEPLGALSGSPAILEAIAAGKGPQRWLIALGYSGWGTGQLEQEMHHHGWHAAAGDPAILFGYQAAERWNATWAAEHIDPAWLVSETGNA